jgi:putative sigma-54 modulation protein
MDIRFVTRNVQISDTSKEYMESKLSKLEKFFDRILDTQIVVSYTRGMHVVEITSNVNGVIMRGEEHAPDMRKAFDKALKNIERQIKRHKSYLQDRVQMKTHDISFGIESFETYAVDEEEILFERRKRVPVKAMTPEEATLQMNLLGHDFFVFKNADTGLINVVYKRKNGGYGLIEPEA